RNQGEGAERTMVTYNNILNAFKIIGPWSKIFDVMQIPYMIKREDGTYLYKLISSLDDQRQHNKQDIMNGINQELLAQKKRIEIGDYLMIVPSNYKAADINKGRGIALSKDIDTSLYSGLLS